MTSPISCQAKSSIIGIKSLLKAISITYSFNKKIINEAGDVNFITKDNLRKVRFDINKFTPHNEPHIDIEKIIKGAKNIKEFQYKIWIRD